MATGLDSHDYAHNYAATLSRIRSNLARLGDWQEIIGALQKLNDKIGKLAPEQLEALKEDLLRPGELFTVDPARMESLDMPVKVAEA